MKSILLFLVLASACLAQLPKGVPADYMLVYQQDFGDAKALGDFTCTDKSVWKHGEDAGKGYIEHFKKSAYKYKVRSPFNIALINRLQVKDFVLDVELQQTGKEYGHRDMCLFYGFTDRSNFYYTHIASATDKHAHNIFLVKDAPRTSISTKTSKGHKWGSKDWHQIRVVREHASGKIEIYINDMVEPKMTATDKSFDWGYIGFGSFDDTGRVAKVRLYAPEKKAGEPDRNIFSE